MQPARAGVRAARLALSVRGELEWSSRPLQQPWSVATLWASLCSQHPPNGPAAAGFSSWPCSGGGGGGGAGSGSGGPAAASGNAPAGPLEDGASAAAAAAAADEAAAAAAFSAHSLPPPSPLLDGGCAALDAVNSLTGLPWWASLPLATLAVKTALLPLSLRQARIVRSNMAIWRESYELARQREVKEAQAARQRETAAAGGFETAGAAAPDAAAVAAAAAAVSRPPAGGGGGGGLASQPPRQTPAGGRAADAEDPLAAARASLEQLQRWHRRVALYSHLRKKCGVPHPAWFLANNLAQWPVLVYLGLCVRSMAQRRPPWPGFDSGGVLWFPDLTLPAVTAAAAGGAAGEIGVVGGVGGGGGGWAGAAAAVEAAAAGAGWALPMGAAGLWLPLLVTGAMVTSIRLGFKASGAASRHPSVAGTFLQPLLRYAPRALYSLTALSFFFKLHLPQAALLHWAASAGFTLSLQLALRRPGVRAALGYGPLPGGAAAAPAAVASGGGGGKGGEGVVGTELAVMAAAAGSADVLVALAARESAAHRYGGAAYCLARAVEMEPGNAGAHYAAAQVAALTGDWAAAEASYSACASAAAAGGPESEYAPFVGQALFCLGTARARLGRPSEALTAYSDAAAAGYAQPHALAQGRGSALLALDRAAEAAAEIDAALSKTAAAGAAAGGRGAAGGFVDMTPVLVELQARIGERLRREAEGHLAGDEGAGGGGGGGGSPGS